MAIRWGFRNPFGEGSSVPSVERQCGGNRSRLGRKKVRGGVGDQR